MKTEQVEKLVDKIPFVDEQVEKQVDKIAFVGVQVETTG